MNLEHGGNISAAAQRFGIPEERWIDLSTGISPWSWPVPAVPEHVWQALPYSDKQLEFAAAQYYGCDPSAVLAVPGSQYALQHTPALLRKGRVAIPQRGYAEHRAAWQRAGHAIVGYNDAAALVELVQAGSVDHALVINPNNPTAELMSARQLQELHQHLCARGGWLVVDEAFGDVSRSESLASLCPASGLIVYRSVGKFFGLAGIRLGFLLAPPSLGAQVASLMPPWCLSHPARWVGEAALRDTTWHVMQQRRLRTAAQQWLECLQASVPALQFVATDLFASGSGDAAYCEALFQALGRRAVLLRLFERIEGYSVLRFGLPLSGSFTHVAQSIREAVEECECDLL
ncbi:Threonine-phosphate decarboxylase [Halioglobus japonicus]|nr:Threonine-phosphate decarboxylase [Halioglobus japonicus]